VIDASFGNIPTTSVRRLTSALSRSRRIGAVDLRAMCFRKAQKRQHGGFRLIHQIGEPRKLRAQLIGYRAPLHDRRFLRILPAALV